MGKTVLVSPEIDRSAELLDVLDKAKLKVSVALWAYLSEYEEWRLVLSGRQFDSAGIREGYLLLHATLDPAGFTPRNTPNVMIIPMTDPFIRELRRLFGKSKSVEGMRLGGQLIGDRFLEDAYVHRIS
jgi:hypothetical protein